MNNKRLISFLLAFVLLAACLPHRLALILCITGTALSVGFPPEIYHKSAP